MALLVWAMMSMRNEDADTLGAAQESQEVVAENGENANQETANSSNSSSIFASELRTFDNSADSIDFDSDFSTAELDAAMNAQ